MFTLQHQWGTINVRYFTLYEDWKNNLLSPQKHNLTKVHTSNDCKNVPFLWSSTNLIVKRYKSIIFPLNILVLFVQNIRFTYIHFPARLSEQKQKQFIIFILVLYIYSFCSIVSLPSSPVWCPLQTRWSAVWCRSRWAALRFESGRRWSWWKSASVPVICFPSLETEMKTDN